VLYLLLRVYLLVASNAQLRSPSNAKSLITEASKCKKCEEVLFSRSVHQTVSVRPHAVNNSTSVSNSHLKIFKTLVSMCTHTQTHICTNNKFVPVLILTPRSEICGRTEI
jgi:hypothetical protein